MDVRVISIGTLGAHPLWSEPADRPPRTGHATTTLIRTGGKSQGNGGGQGGQGGGGGREKGSERVILVDPGLPPAGVLARLFERSGLSALDVTDVFLTSFQPDTRRGIGAFAEAAWWIAEAEKEAILPALESKRNELRDLDDGDENRLLEVIEDDLAVLRRCRVAPDHLADGVDLFPLPGVTPGLCGLLLADPRSTTLVCGDAIATVEHLSRGMILPDVADADSARESFKEAVEIADVLILGRDNERVNPLR